MIQDEHPLAEWLTGIRSGPRTGDRRTVVVQAPQLLGDLIAQGLVDEQSELFLGSSGSSAVPAMFTAGRHRPLRTFHGSFTLADDDIVLDNGYRMNLRQYGSAEFHCLDTPTALRVADAHDLSAYLRDADQAWQTGTFARHITHPNAIVTDLAGLGGGADRSGPADRIYVFPDAAVSTSPTGNALGSTTEQLPVLVQRWQQANEASRRPDATCLAQAVSELDRTDALLERPWLSRYLLAVKAIQRVRRSHRVPDRVSGFGGRLTPGLGRPIAADGLGAPVLLQVGNEYQAHDGYTGAHVVLSAGAVVSIETMLTADGTDAPGPAYADGETMRLLSKAGISEQWRRDFRWE